MLWSVSVPFGLYQYDCWWPVFWPCGYICFSDRPLFRPTGFRGLRQSIDQSPECPSADQFFDCLPTVPDGSTTVDLLWNWYFDISDVCVCTNWSWWCPLLVLIYYDCWYWCCFCVTVAILQCCVLISTILWHSCVLVFHTVVWASGMASDCSWVSTDLVKQGINLVWEICWWSWEHDVYRPSCMTVV